MSYYTRQAIDLAPPVEYLSGHNWTGVFIRATVTTHEPITIPSYWFDQYLTCIAKTSDVHILFGDSSVAATINTATSVTATVPTLQHTSSLPIIAGGAPVSFRLPKATDIITHFSHISADTSGFLYIYVSNNLR